MEDVKIENRRFEPDQNEALDDLSKRFAKAFGFRSQTLEVAAELAQLLRLRVSQLNHCTFCMNLHAQAARDLGIARARIDTLSAWGGKPPCFRRLSKPAALEARRKLHDELNRTISGGTARSVGDVWAFTAALDELRWVIAALRR